MNVVERAGILLLEEKGMYDIGHNEHKIPFTAVKHLVLNIHGAAAGKKMVYLKRIMHMPAEFIEIIPVLELGAYNRFFRNV